MHTATDFEALLKRFCINIDTELRPNQLGHLTDDLVAGVAINGRPFLNLPVLIEVSFPLVETLSNQRIRDELNLIVSTTENKKKEITFMLLRPLEAVRSDMLFGPTLNDLTGLTELLATGMLLWKSLDKPEVWVWMRIPWIHCMPFDSNKP